MKLGTLIERLPNGLNDSLCIFAAKPWSASSPAAAVQLDDGFQPPKEVTDQGLVYFLEVHVANETLEVFGDRTPTEAEKRDLLIFYAANDAFPEWVYKR
jgi:regulator of sirC expression with transglutaminase-like and TPR domain